MRSTFLLVVCVGVIGLGAVSAFGEGTGGQAKLDRRLKSALDKSKLKYTVDDDGDVRLTFEYANSRSQLVVVGSATDKLGSQEVRSVISYVLETEKDLPADLANRLLSENLTLKVGCWARSATAVVFSARVPATADGKVLGEILPAVAKVADKLEAELSPKDEF